MTSAFENLAGPGKPLRAEPPDSKEFAGLQRMGLARLKDAQHQGLSLESQFDLAYNHDVRNLGEYEGMLEVDTRLVTDLITACQLVANKLSALLPLNQP